MRPDKTRAKARADMNDLISELRKMGFVCIKTMGYYQGGSEQSLFVADANNRGNLKEVLMHFGKKYEQDTILYKELGRGSKLIVTRGKKFGNETKNAHSTSFGKSTTANYSKVGGRTFSDTIDIDDDFWPEDEETLMNTFKYEIDESKQSDAAMNCLKNRNKHRIAQEEEETSLIDMFDERFEYRSDLRKMANDTTKEAYMIIRKEFGDSMWRQLGMDDCDERGLIDELNWMQETYGITNAQKLADVQLGRKSVKNFKKTEEQEEYLTAYDNEDPVWRVINVMRKYGMFKAKGMSGAKGMRYDDGLAIDAAYDLIEQKLDEDDVVIDDKKDAVNFVVRFGREIAEKAMKSGIHNHRKSVNEQEEEKIKLSKSEMEDLAFRLADYLCESFIVLEDQDEQYGDLLAAVEKILEEDVPNPESTKDCYAWCRKWHQKIEGLTYSYYNDPNPLSYYDEQEEEVQGEVMERIINDGLGFWDVWEMWKRGEATKIELEVAGVLLELFETLMYTGQGEILGKVDSGEIDKRLLKRVIVDVLLEQDVDTYPSNETEYNSWVRKHNEEIIERLGEIVGVEEQEEEPWEIHYPTEKELMNIARLNKVSVDDIFEAEICDHYLCALEYGDDTALDEEDEKLLDEWCTENRYLHQLTQNDGEFPEAYFGKCDICGMVGNVVPVLCVKKAGAEEQEEIGVNRSGMHNLVQHGHIMNTPSMHDTYDSEWFSNRDEQKIYYDSFRIIAELVADQIDRENGKDVEINMDTLFDIVIEVWKKSPDDLWVVDEADENDCYYFFDIHYEEIKNEYLKREHEDIMNKTHGDLFGQDKRKILRKSRSRIVNALVKQLQKYGISMTDKEDIEKASKKVNEILDRTGDYPDLKNFSQMVSWCKEHHLEVAKYIYR